MRGAVSGGVSRVNGADRRPLVVVLGASGFVGSAVSRALAARPIRLRLVARRPAVLPPEPAVERAARVEVLAADLTEPGVLAGAVAGADAVVHLVARTDGGWRVADGDVQAERVNVGLASELVRAMRASRDGARPPAVLFAGSGLTGQDRIGAAGPGHPASAYCRQKLAAEYLLERATADGVLRAVSLRLPSVYGTGPGVDPKVVELMVRRALAGEPLTMWHDGTVRRDLIYVEDVAAAFLAALDHVDALAGRYWLVGTGSAVPLGAVFAEIADLVAAHTGRPRVPVVRVPPPANAYPTDLMDMEIDSTAFRTVTGWRPTVPLRDGLVRTVTALAGPPVESRELAPVPIPVPAGRY